MNSPADAIAVPDEGLKFINLVDALLQPLITLIIANPAEHSHRLVVSPESAFPVGTGPHKRGRGTKKTPVFGMVERGGKIHRRVVANVTGATLKGAMREMIHEDARVMTDENRAYLGLGPEFKGGHDTITHSAGEYARGDVNTNSIESSFALVKRGLIGIYHAVSKEHLHRYVSEFDFRWNARTMNDGERTALAIESAIGKRLRYRTPTDA
jgi:transposase-like protein